MMEAFSLILAIGIAAFLLLYFAFNLDRKEHFGLVLLNIGFAVAFLVLIGKTGMDYEDHCQLELNQTIENITAPNYTVTDHTYSYFCDTNARTTPLVFYNTTLRYMQVFVIYIFLFTSYILLKRYTRLGKKKL